MAASAKSHKEYLERYESSNNEDEMKKKRKKNQKSKTEAMGIKVVDEDPVWQKPVKLDNNSGDEEEKPLVDEDIDLKRMRRLELLRARRPGDGSGWFQVPLEGDLSPPRKRYRSPSKEADLSPPRKRGNNVEDVSPPRKRQNNVEDVSPPRNKTQVSPGPLKEKTKSGLISGRDIREEISKTKRAEQLRLQQLDPSETGENAANVFRNKKTGERISEEEKLKSEKKLDEKPKEIKVEWGEGLAQKREAEAKLEALEREKEKPFARTRDDRELDKTMKERVRWGDPMAHLVKRKRLPEALLPNLGDNEKMKESGFIIPQDIPDHSWLKRGIDAAPNRYGIKPGRYWDGVDRSKGYEKDLFTRTNEKRATQAQAYLSSVADM